MTASIHAVWTCGLCGNALHVDPVSTPDDVQTIGNIVMAHTYAHLEDAS